MAAPEDSSHFSRHVCGTAERLGIPATQAQAQIIPAEPPHVPQDGNLRELILFILGQLHTLERSLFAELERSQVETLAMLFTLTRVEGKAYWCREGEDAHTLAIIIAGALVVQNDSDIDPVAYLLPGDTTGETELCGNRSRGSAVRALMPTLVAEIDFEELTQFIEVRDSHPHAVASQQLASTKSQRNVVRRCNSIEAVQVCLILTPGHLRLRQGLGLKTAKKVTKIIADTVLERVKAEAERLERQDRQILQHIGRRRRAAICSMGSTVAATSHGPPVAILAR